MKVQGRTFTPETAILLASLAVLFFAFDHCAAQPPRMPETFLEDAELADVFFLDPDRGWAVGDRGVIWFTEDGGRHWRLQYSPVPCRFESVSFIDDRHGWIVGGWTHPFTHRSTGIVLRTSDGGQRWEVLPRLSLPALKRVQFFDARRGWAAGSASALYPAGIFRTEDGGLSWSSVAPVGNAGWLSGDFYDDQCGVVAGRGPLVASVTQSSVAPGEAPEAEPRAARCVRLSSATSRSPSLSRGGLTGWLVGDGGLVLKTPDGGRSWSGPPARLPGGMADYFDFSGVALAGDLCWIVGSPGTRVLHTADGGRSWQIFDTGQALPLSAVTFLDEHRGWAVGALGTILATRDGGRTWTLQHRGGEQAAWLCLFSQTTQLPLELAVDLSSNDGFLGAVEIVGSASGAEKETQQSHPEDRLREAVSIVGGSYANLAWGFPLPVAGRDVPMSVIVGGWDRVHGSASQSHLHEYLVRKIRQWRPEIIVTDPLRPRGQNDLAQLINQTVLAAVDAAADPLAETDQALVTGLRPWQTKKVFSYEGRDQSATLNLTTSQLAPQLGQSLADQAALGWQLLQSHHEWPAQTLGFRLLLNRLPVELGRQSFFSGISLPQGGEARRQLGAPPPKDLRAISRLIQQRRNIEHLLRYASESSRRGAAWLGQVEDLIRGLDPQSSGRVLFELGQSLEQSGQTDLAAEVYDFLLRRFPEDPLGEAAAIWLILFSASSEAAWAFRPSSLAVQAVVPASADPATDTP
ncbi:MAG: YCF48-related protein, partial [Planctomycetes bacterium]|nr:YCF48-related protein [Planctomycetota bacterium]